ncbi:P-loop NTPase [Limisalsivibrio acetivorans]|uniref:nucleotide-binding protein n=1 Tax=Limisalsivibrio acetivorans TaxID=1304888 RepID=UPI0003B6E240|nr:P-loop NTPase [Limisalsivibrio acetivorans]
MAEIISVASGKGGVGKSFFSSNIAMALSSAGSRVLLVDADLGGANLHDFVGIRVPGVGLYDFLKEKAPIDKVIQNTPAQVDFIGGSGDILGMAHITNYEKLKVLNKLKALDYDHVILDLGAGTSYNMIDFFNSADRKVMLMNSEPTSLENSYGFLKVALYRKIEQLLRKDYRFADICKKLRSKSMNYPSVSSIKDSMRSIDVKLIPKVEEIAVSYKVGIVLNMLKTKKELNVFYGFENVAKKYLSIDIEKLGFIPYDIRVSESVKKLKPFYINNLSRDVCLCIDDLRKQLLAKL